MSVRKTCNQFVSNHVCKSKVVHSPVRRSKSLGVDALGRRVYFGILLDVADSHIEQRASVVLVYDVVVQRFNVGKQKVRRSVETRNARSFESADHNFKFFRRRAAYRSNLGNHSHCVQIRFGWDIGAIGVDLADKKNLAPVIYSKSECVTRNLSCYFNLCTYVGKEEVSPHCKNRHIAVFSQFVTSFVPDGFLHAARIRKQFSLVCAILHTLTAQSGTQWLRCSHSLFCKGDIRRNAPTQPF